MESEFGSGTEGFLKLFHAILIEVTHKPVLRNHCSRMTKYWSLHVSEKTQSTVRIYLNYTNVMQNPWSNSLSGVLKKLPNTQCEINDFSLSGGKTWNFQTDYWAVYTICVHLFDRYTSHLTMNRQVVVMLSGNTRNLCPNVQICCFVLPLRHREGPAAETHSDTALWLEAITAQCFCSKKLQNELRTVPPSSEAMAVMDKTFYVPLPTLPIPPKQKDGRCWGSTLSLLKLPPHSLLEKNQCWV